MNMKKILKYEIFCRVLLWSLSPIAEARVRIDDSEAWLLLTHVEGPLYVSRWNAYRYGEGMHTLEVNLHMDQGFLSVYAVFCL